MINVENKLKVYLESEEKSLEDQIIIKNHPYKRCSVILVIDGKEYTVRGYDLTTSIDNALNVNRHSL
jgi:hypothetical protein